jgi:hypothetical protein
MPRFTDGGTPVTGTAAVTLQFGEAQRRVMLYKNKTIRATGASGTNIQPRVYNTSGGAAGAITDEWRAASATAPGTLVNTTEINQLCVLDANQRLYYTVGGDVADTFSYALDFHPVD